MKKFSDEITFLDVIEEGGYTFGEFYDYWNDKRTDQHIDSIMAGLLKRLLIRVERLDASRQKTTVHFDEDDIGDLSRFSKLAKQYSKYGRDYVLVITDAGIECLRGQGVNPYMIS